MSIRRKHKPQYRWRNGEPEQGQHTGEHGRPAQAGICICRLLIGSTGYDTNYSGMTSQYDEGFLRLIMLLFRAAGEVACLSTCFFRWPTLLDLCRLFCAILERVYISFRASLCVSYVSPLSDNDDDMRLVCLQPLRFARTPQVWTSLIQLPEGGNDLALALAPTSARKGLVEKWREPRTGKGHSAGEVTPMQLPKGKGNKGAHCMRE